MIDTLTAPRALLTIRELDSAPNTAERWDRFVEGCPNATFFHKAGWKRVIETSFSHRAIFLYAERAGEIVGVLPLVHLNSRLFGRALVSSAFCVEGGPATADDAARAALIARAAELADELNVDYVEFRGAERAAPAWDCKDDLYAVFRRTLAPDPDRALAAVPRKQRAVIRQSLQTGLAATVEDGPADFFAAYSHNLRSLGTPAFPRSYFRELKARFGDDCEILAVRHGKRVVAGLMTFYFRGRVLPYYGGGTEEARDTGAYNFMYWDVMRRACLSGHDVFDFGRSKRGTGAFAYKKNWGFEPQPLYHEYLVRRGAVPEKHALNPKFQPFIALWKRLPLSVANGLGPLIVRNFG